MSDTIIITEAVESRGPVLLVEDDPFVALVAQQILEDHGFRVTVAGQGRAAVGAARAAAEDPEAEAFVLAVVDLGLPDIGGDEVVRALRARTPNLPIIIATGYDTTELQEEFGAMARLILLSKPYNGATLCAALRGVGFDVPE
mgnify:CR=1 FL=1